MTRTRMPLTRSLAASALALATLAGTAGAASAAPATPALTGIQIQDGVGGKPGDGVGGKVRYIDWFWTMSNCRAAGKRLVGSGAYDSYRCDVSWGSTGPVVYPVYKLYVRY